MPTKKKEGRANGSFQADTHETQDPNWCLPKKPPKVTKIFVLLVFGVFILPINLHTSFCNIHGYLKIYLRRAVSAQLHVWKTSLFRPLGLALFYIHEDLQDMQY